MFTGLIQTIVGGIDSILDKFIPDANVREQTRQAIMNEALNWAKLEAQDRDSARRREAETKDPTTRELAWVYTIGYFGCLAALLFGWVQITESMRGLVDVLFGVLTAGQYSIMAYYFGSSQGSAHKDSVIGNIVSNGKH
jgi:hypothetical protein